MKKRFITLSLFLSLVCWIAIILMAAYAASAQTIASRRLNLSSQTGIAFGAFSSVAPYNEANGYTAVSTLGQLQPSGLINGSSTFSSTANFNNSGGTACTFSVASNIGTVACAANAGSILQLNTGSALTVPAEFLSITIESNGTAGAGGWDNAGIGITKNASNFLGWALDHRNSFLVAYEVIGGTQNTQNNSFAIPTAPWQLGVSFVGNEMCAWTNTGSGWIARFCQNVSAYYNLLTSGNLTGWLPGIYQASQDASTWTYESFSAGLMGGVGLTNAHLVITPDGRPYAQGSTVYFTAGLPDSVASFGGGIFSYNVVSGTLTQIGSLWGDYPSGTFFGNASSTMLYDPHNNTERLVAQNGINNTYILYASQSISTDDWLATGPHITPVMTQLTSSTGDSIYDPSLACVQGWNPSTGACSKWLLAMADQSPGFPHGQTSTVDPSSNTWTTLFTDTANGNYEGAVITRTATTYSGNGVNYQACFGGLENSATRSSRCYNMAGTFVAGLNVTWPTAISPYNPSHPQMFCLGNKAYLLGFNNNSYNGVAQTLGNFIVATSTSGCGQ